MTRQDKIVLGLTVFLSLLWKFYVIFNSDLTFFSDDAIYAQLARFWVQGKLDLVFHPTWPPFYPLASAIIFFFVREWESALRVVSALSGSLIVLPIFLLARIFLPKWSAYTLALLSTFVLPVTRISLAPQSDMLATLLSITVFALMVQGLKSGRFNYFYVASVFLGLVYLTRSEGFLFFLLSTGYLALWLVVQITTKKLHFSKLIALLFFVLIFLLTSSPYIVITKNQTGSWSLSQKASAQLQQGHSFAVNKKGTTWIQEVVSVKKPNYTSEYFKNGLDYVLEHSDWFGFWFVEKLNVWKTTFIYLFPIWTWPLITVGVLSVFAKKEFWPFGYLLFISFVSIPATIFATPIADVRYLLWAILITMLILFKGLNNVFTLLKVKKTWLAALVGLVLPFFSLLSPVSALKPAQYAADFTNNYYWPEIKEVGKWIKNNSTKGEPIIMLRHEGAEFYSEGLTIYLPQGLDTKELLEYAKKNNVEYIIAWDVELASDPNLSVLLNPKFSQKGYIKVYALQDSNAKPKIIVYKVK